MYHLRFQGDHYSMGVKRGRIFQKCKMCFPLHLDPFQLEHGRRSEKILKDFFPEVCAEIKGVSDAMGADYGVLIFWMLCMGCCMYKKDKIVCAVNRFTSDEMRPFDMANGDDYFSDRRYQTVLDSFPAHIQGDYIETTRRLLKGDYGFMCQYDGPNFETVWSSIFDLKTLKIYRAEGDPRREKFAADNRLHGMVNR